MQIRILGAHNQESRDTRFACLLIDGRLALDAGALTSSLSLEAQQELQAVLLTHQHYDHVRDIPSIGINRFLEGSSIRVCCTRTVRDVLETHLLDGRLYPKFLEWPEGNPAIRATVMEPSHPVEVAGYGVLAAPVNHTDSAVGYQVTAAGGKKVFCTGDTGPGLAECWKLVSPDLLVIEVTVPDRDVEFARNSSHLTPGLLMSELTAFRDLKGYLPRVVIVHMNPAFERDIEREVAAVAGSLNASITLGHEGMELQV